MDPYFLDAYSDAIKFFSNVVVNYKTYKARVSTRRQTTTSTGSCRLWQLILSILDQLEQKEYNVKEAIGAHYDLMMRHEFNDEVNARYEAVADKVRTIIHSIIYADPATNPNPELYGLIALNNPDYVNNFNPSTMGLNLGLNHLCIYIEKIPEVTETHHSILHYFSIYKVSDDEYYLNSSYGSDYVCVPQYTTPLDVDEFVRFVNALNNEKTDDDFIEYFFVKYFLTHNIGVRYSEDDIENDRRLYNKWIMPDEGNTREVNVIRDNKYRSRITCGIMPNYGEWVSNAIDHVAAMDGGRKKRKRTIKRGRGRKHAATKRRRSSRSSKRYSR